MSQFVRYRGAANSWVRFTMPSNGRVTAQYEFRSSATSVTTLFNTLDPFADRWRGCVLGGGSSTNVRVQQLFVDGVLTTATTQGQLSNLVRDGNWHTLRYVAWSRSGTGPDNTNQHLTGEQLEFANYSQFAASPVADLRNFKIDVGLTGSWTHESTLGDSNGFSQQNVDILTIGSRRRRHSGSYGL